MRSEEWWIKDVNAEMNSIDNGREKGWMVR